MTSPAAQPFVHCAEVILDDGADPSAPGGAVTIALCGTWDHEGACRWPHHTRADWQDRRGSLRVVFIANAADEAHVRALIASSLHSGHCTGPTGLVSRWVCIANTAGVLTVEEREWAAKITPGPERS